MMHPDFEYIRIRWLDLMVAFSLNENIITFQKLVRAYSETHRAYHTLDHILACFKHLDKVSHDSDNPHEIELALWFHDAIYDPFSKTNEEDSADWAKSFMEAQNLEAEIRERVYALIIMTKEHMPPDTSDARLMLDIDLSILGTPEAVYDQFEKDVRFEYRRVPRFLFRRKRKQILQSFLDRDHIYQTKSFADKLEAQARFNLSRAIANL